MVIEISIYLILTAWIIYGALLVKKTNADLLSIQKHHQDAPKTLAVLYKKRKVKLLKHLALSLVLASFFVAILSLLAAMMKS